MFTKIHLENFRSFGNITLDLMAKNAEPRKLAVVFGENGAGKSNLTSAFVLLRELLSTMDVRDMYADFLSQKAIFTDENLENIMRTQFRSGMRDIQAIINDVRMVGSDQPVVAEYEFEIGGKPGRYQVHLGQKEIIYEKLEFTLTKRRGVYFECSDSRMFINTALTKDKDLLKDIKSATKKFWGKHSVLAIIDHEMRDKSEAYGIDNIADNFYDIYAMLSVTSCYTGIGRRRWDRLSAPLDILTNASKGKLLIEDEPQLDIAEQIFSSFFSAINSDIKKVSYRRNCDDKYVQYELVFDKFIAGQYREIEFSRESAGNHQILRVLCYLISACFGGISVIDEADSGIHDMLFLKMLKEIYPCISGQVIMTSHNTLLMETEFARDSTYILSEDNSGNKTVKSILDYDQRTYINNNVRTKYLNNGYGGVPQVSPIKFDQIIKTISDAMGE